MIHMRHEVVRFYSKSSISLIRVINRSRGHFLMHSWRNCRFLHAEEGVPLSLRLNTHSEQRHSLYDNGWTFFTWHCSHYALHCLPNNCFNWWLLMYNLVDNNIVLDHINICIKYYNNRYTNGETLLWPMDALLRRVNYFSARSCTLRCSFVLPKKE